MSFIERFKGKTSNISKQGEIIEIHANPGVKKSTPIVPSNVTKPTLASIRIPSQKLYSNCSYSPTISSHSTDRSVAIQAKEPRSSGHGLKMPLESFSASQSPPVFHGLYKRSLPDNPLLSNAKLALQLNSLLPGLPVPKDPASFVPSPKPIYDRKNLHDLVNSQFKSPNPEHHRHASIDSLSFHDKLNEGTYKPYTLKEYQEQYLKEYTSFGGLGANTGGQEWQDKKIKRERMTEYAKRAQVVNTRRFVNSAERLSVPDQEIQKFTLKSNLRRKMTMECGKEIIKGTQQVETLIPEEES